MTAKFPKQIRYIIGNEACERFSFYGMRSILVVFMVQYLLMKESSAKGLYHTFVTAAYFTPLLGGYLSDRFFGKYHTIMGLSLVYCIGHAVLAIWDNEAGMYAGLALIALGAGGIKPCVSAHVGDQFDETNKHLLSKVFAIFYFAINFGSFFATLTIPWTLAKLGPSWAFGIPGILMFLATIIFWMGRHYYVFVPPTGKEGSSNFFGVVGNALLKTGQKRSGESWLDVSKPKYGEERVEGAKAVLAIFKVFITVAAFWALFEQQGSTWILQAQKMNLTVLGITFTAAQVHSLNPVLVMLFVPLFSFVIYPAFERQGIRVTPLRKMSAGMLLTGFAFVACGILQVFLDRGYNLSVAWQGIAYVLMTGAEILVSITGLEFAYTQTPRAMKSTVMGLWFLTISIGNWFTAVVSYMNPFRDAMEFFFYAGLMFVVSLIFIAIASRYRERNYIEAAASH